MTQTEKADDIAVQDHGSVVLLKPKSPTGRDWIDEHIGPNNGYQPYYPTVVCEARFVDNIVLGMLGDGLAVSC